MMALADVFDALTTPRVYKEPWPVEKAVDLIRAQRGLHFDPAVVDAFEAGFATFLQIQQYLADTLPET
jgi:putative two-component system response regulator